MCILTDDPRYHRLERPADVRHESNGVVPKFEPGTVVGQNSLVIDKFGVAWWVRPEVMTIVKAGPALGATPDTDHG